MSIKHLADHVAAHGRNGDTELVHVSKDELRALHGLASIGGTRLTTNPHTGLQEAFNLTSLIPIAAGVAGSFVGMPWLGALAAGALTTAQTGSLQKGLVAGMGSYALGGLGSAALGAGANTLASGAADAATQAGTQAATNAATQGATQSATDLAAQGGMAATPDALAGAGLGGGTFSQNAIQEAAQAQGQQGMQGALGQSFPRLSQAQLQQVTSEGTPDLMAQRAAMLNQFGQANYTMNPSGSISQAAPIGGQFNPSAMDKLSALNGSDYMNIAKENPGAVLGTGTMLMSALQSPNTMPKQQSEDSVLSRAHLVPDYYTRNSRAYTSGGLATLGPSRYACGGMVSFDSGGPVDPNQTPGNNTLFPQANIQSPMYSQATQVPSERSVIGAGYEQPTNDYGDQMFAQGGLASLGGHGGRALHGPGDGMSDDIPATIEGKQPARLADGEYVVSADAVSHLGNGSTDAGTRKLDQMMSRIRKARTGTAKQGKQVNADRFLPA